MKSACVICAHPGGEPKDVILKLKYNWVTAPKRACLPDYVCLVARKHVEEPFELEDSGAWWMECMAVARGLKKELNSRKLNYEIHGNTITHLHLHIYPRFSGDPFESRPIDGASSLFVRSRTDLDRLRNAIQSSLSA